MIEFKFKNIEEDLGIANKQICSEYKAKGLDVSTGNNWLKPFQEAFGAVVRAYTDAGKFDVVIDYLLDQLDGSGGYEHFLYVSNALIAKKENDRLMSMWRTLVRMRKRLRKSEALIAMQHFAEVLKKAGNEDGCSKVNQEIEAYSSDVKVEYPTLDKRAIDEVIFWEILQKTKIESDNVVSRPDVLLNILLNFKAPEIKRFDQLFQDKMQASYTWDLWGVAHIALGGCSDDGFDYFRAWLISEGKEIYCSVIADPESIADLQLKPVKMEPLLYVAGEAFELKSQKTLTTRKRKRTKPAGVEWNENDVALRERFSRAWRYFERV